MPWKLLARDALIVALAQGAYAAGAAATANSGGLLLGVAGVLAGVTLGFAWGFVGHEWGHFAGARLGGARIHPVRALASPVVFRFREEENDRRRFLWMAWGGLVGVWLPPLCFAVALSTDAPGLAALLFAAGGALYTTAVEGPKLLRGA